MSKKFNYVCISCGNVFSPDKIRYLCPDCSDKNINGMPPLGILKLVYTYNKTETVDRKDLKQGLTLFEELKTRQFTDILPAGSSNFPKLRVGQTPVYSFEQLNKKQLKHRLFFKDDSQNPTYSFKDRASSLVSAYAKENGIDTIIAASTGNAGSSLAGICASQNQKAIIFVPETAPLAKLSQIIMYGARLVPIKGTYDDAFDLSIKASETYGWYNRNTAYNPLTIEGKKTVSFEIYDQFGFSLPHRIFVPVGDGVIISGVYKGFEDLLNLGIIDQIPIVVAIQANGSNNLIRNMNTGVFQIIPSRTIADSISVDIPRNFYMARDYLQKYKGETLSIADDEIINASSSLSRNTGLFAEPAAASAFAGYLHYVQNHKIEDNTDNLVLLTGSGLKDIKSLANYIKMPASIHPEIEELDKFLNN